MVYVGCLDLFGFGFGLVAVACIVVCGFDCVCLSRVVFGYCFI